MTDAHLQRTCSEIVHLQTKSCDHTLNNARRGAFSEMECCLQQQRQHSVNLYHTMLGV